MITSWLNNVETMLYEQLDSGDIEEEDFEIEHQRQVRWATQEVELVLVRAELRRLRAQVERLESVAET